MTDNHIVIDSKNLRLYNGGISAFVKPLVQAWLAHLPHVRFSFVGPSFNTDAFAGFKNWTHHVIAWPTWLPSKLRHPFYDNVQFPGAVSKLNPHFVFSPYHDVLLPRGPQIRSVMTVHDTCIKELDQEYPAAFRAYYLTMLRRNLKRSTHVLTVSESSRARIIEEHVVQPSKVTIIYNAIPPEFAEAKVDKDLVSRLRVAHSGAKLVFYPGGSEFRKNIGRLVDAFAMLTASTEDDYRLLVTGNQDFTWARELARYDDAVSKRVDFVGYLTTAQLKAYYAAAHSVVYPSLCEGFGRVCLEAMAVGTPIACSNLQALYEVGGDYPLYFDPLDTTSIVSALRRAVALSPMPPRSDPRFSLAAVVSRFTDLMDRLLSE